jgi:Holliday junction resolvase RusA-like endonuclease
VVAPASNGQAGGIALFAAAGPAPYTVTVPGPNPGKGSKNGYLRGRRVILVDTNDHQITRWERQAVAELAKQAPAKPHDGPAAVFVRIYGRRPAAHHVAGKRERPLREPAPHWASTCRPDGDKAERLAWDCLKKAGILSDDVRITAWGGEKVWAGPGEPERTEVYVWPLQEWEGNATS